MVRFVVRKQDDERSLALTASLETLVHLVGSPISVIVQRDVWGWLYQEARKAGVRPDIENSERVSFTLGGVRIILGGDDL